MNILTDIPDIDPGMLNNSAGDDRAKMIFTAVHYDIFTRLVEFKSAEKIAGEAGMNPALTEKFLNVLTALGLLRKTGDMYSNTRLSEIYLSEKSVFYQGNLFRMRMRGSTDWIRIKDALKTGPGVSSNDSKAYIDDIFIDGHAEAAINGSLQRAVRAVSGLPEFKKAKKILDLGGGHGLYAAVFSMLNPESDIYLFDLPHVTKMALKYFKKFRIDGKVKLIPGDFLNDGIGSGYDIIFASDVTIDGIFGKINEALNPEGVLIYRRWTLNDDRISPLTSVMFDFNMAISGNGHCIRTLNEYIALFEGAGLHVTGIIDQASEEDPTKIMIAKRSE